LASRSSEICGSDDRIDEVIVPESRLANKYHRIVRYNHKDEAVPACKHPLNYEVMNLDDVPDEYEKCGICYPNEK
jgi:hypothetical protein